MPRTKKIPSKPRFSYATTKAYELLVMLGISTFPVNPWEIIGHFPNWKLRTGLEMKNGTNGEDVLKGADGKTLTERDSRIYYIVYDERESNAQRVRWTLAHEIGHIVLGHLDDFEATSLLRRGLTDKQYGTLEAETNWFAESLLAPKIILKHFNCQSNPSILRTMCDISQQATDTLLGHLAIAERAYPPVAIHVLRDFYRHIVSGHYSFVPKELKGNNIVLPVAYEDYMECDYWEFIIMCIRDWEKNKLLSATLKNTVAYYDCEDMVIFASNDTAALVIAERKVAILNCLEKYANSPVRNITVAVTT